MPLLHLLPSAFISILFCQSLVFFLLLLLKFLVIFLLLRVKLFLLLLIFLVQLGISRVRWCRALVRRQVLGVRRITRTRYVARTRVPTFSIPSPRISAFRTMQRACL